jgi:hypothetical protein
VTGISSSRYDASPFAGLFSRKSFSLREELSLSSHPYLVSPLKRFGLPDCVKNDLYVYVHSYLIQLYEEKMTISTLFPVKTMQKRP